uniref:Ras-associating domain-containing protein n=1 Tax=Globodera rostochiensis TaxID=31243 RepID=A0A914HA82_GLORO
MVARRGRPLIRAILFIVRLRRDAQEQQRRRTTLRRMGALAQTAGRVRQGQGMLSVVGATGKSGGKAGRGREKTKLNRCESSRQQRTVPFAARIGRELSRQQRHRNSAPSMLFLRSPTPQPTQSFSGSAQSLEDRGRSGEQSWAETSIDFASFLRMPQPYQLKLDKSNQLSVQPSAAHQLAAQSLFRHRTAWGTGGSLDDSKSDGGRIRTPSEFSNKFFHRQGSVEAGGRAAKSGRAPDWEGPRRKLKAGMVGMVGALSALEKGDLEALGAVLCRSRGNGDQNGAAEEFRPTETLSTGIYALFPQKVTLLDVALMLGRREAAEMLMEFGARDGAEVPSVEQRRSAVERVVEQCEGRAAELRERDGKDEEKQLHLLISQLTVLRQMRCHLSGSGPMLPSPPENVSAECVSPSAALLRLALPSGSTAVVRLRVEWSHCAQFSTIDGCLEVDDIRHQTFLVDSLSLGHELAFRVSAASIWGWGLPAMARPPILRISSWTELVGEEGAKAEILDGRRLDSKELTELVEKVERYRQSAVWSKLFQNCSGEREKKRRTGLRHLFSASSKFVKNVQRGLFLTTVFYTEERILCTVDDCLPVISVDECATGLPADDLHWLMKLSLCWEQLPHLQESFSSSTASSANSQLRSRLLDAALAMHNALGVKDIGRVHHVPLVSQPGTTLLVTARLVPEGQCGEAQGLAMRWMRMEKMFRRRQACPSLEFLSRELLPLLNFYESSLISLEPGLYLAYLRLHSSLNSIHVLVPDTLISSLPFASMRSNPHVTREEWALLKSLAEATEESEEQLILERALPEQRRFHHQLTKAASRLIHDLELDPEQLQGTRLFRHRLVQLNERVSLILVMPRVEDVCQVNTYVRGGDNTSAPSPCRGCVSVPVPVFQMINLATYQPDFLSSYCSLSIFLDHFLTITQYEQRQCLLENNARMLADQLAQLSEFQQQLETIWRSARWISAFASVARDRGSLHRHWALPLIRLLCCSDEWRDGQGNDGSRCRHRNNNNNNDRNVLPKAKDLISSQRTTDEEKANCSTKCPSPQLLGCGASSATRLSHSLNSSPNLTLQRPSPLVLSPNLSPHKSYPHFLLPSPSSSAPPTVHTSSPSVPMPSPATLSAIVRVYASYETGLPQRNISVRLRISGETCAGEVVQLVVRQLAKLNSCRSPKTSGLPSPDPGQFCLVSVVGVRERRLRDEFRVLLLPSPWDKGTLCVRCVHSLSAAIDLANESAV